MRVRDLDPKKFEEFLKANRKTVFGILEKSCPLARWLNEEVTIEDLDSFPPWANRFHGAWEDRYQWADVPPGIGRDALKILRRSLV